MSLLLDNFLTVHVFESFIMIKPRKSIRICFLIKTSFIYCWSRNGQNSKNAIVCFVHVPVENETSHITFTCLWTGRKIWFLKENWQCLTCPVRITPYGAEFFMHLTLHVKMKNLWSAMGQSYSFFQIFIKRPTFYWISPYFTVNWQTTHIVSGSGHFQNLNCFIFYFYLSVSCWSVLWVLQDVTALIQHNDFMIFSIWQVLRVVDVNFTLMFCVAM